jgi:hypothetical protein
LYSLSSAKLTVAEQRTVDKIEDYEINVGGLLTSWNPASHSAYWEDDDFTVPVTSFLRSLLKALDS